MKPIKNKAKLFNILIYSLLTIVPPTATGGICQYLNVTSVAQATYSTLFTLGSNISSRIAATSNSIDSSMSLLTHSQDFHSLNKEEITRQLNLARYYNPKLYNNIVVIDKNHNFIYGITTDDLSKSSSVQSTLSTGTITYEYLILESTPVVKICYPILKTVNNSFEPVGVILCELNVDYMDPILSSINVFGEDIEAYLVDENGILISNSRYLPNAKGSLRMDIDKIKLAIDYNPYKPFKNYRDKETYGVYFKISNLNWNLIITNDINTISAPAMSTIGYLSALSGIGGLGTVEILKKIYEKKMINLDELCSSLKDSNEEDKEQ